MNQSTHCGIARRPHLKLIKGANSTFTPTPPARLRQGIGTQMIVRFATALLTGCALSACASLPSGRDELCEPLREFASSVGPDEERSIAFHTSWGSNFRNDPEPAIFAKQCVHGNYGPAKAVCAYLLEHGAVEFAGGNVQRALSCLASGTQFGPDIDLSQGIFHIDLGTSNRGSHVTVEYARDQELGGMVLRVNVDGY